MELKEKPTHFYSIFFAEKNNRVRKRIYLYNNQQITKKIFFPFQRDNIILRKTIAIHPKSIHLELLECAV